MAALAENAIEMVLLQAELQRWGQIWRGTDLLPDDNGNQPLDNNGVVRTKRPNYFTKKQGTRFPGFIDQSFGNTLAQMLGGIRVVRPNRNSLLPQDPDCVEVGPVRVVGGVRPQDFDVAYRPDGPRIVFDSKSLNEAESVGKNWQNMINDLATESTTVHTRYPYAVVCFLIAIPEPALAENQARDIIRTLERLGTREDVIDQHHLAEAIAFVVWDPDTGQISDTIPAPNSNLRIEGFSNRIFHIYCDRYKGLPPHNV